MPPPNDLHALSALRSTLSATDARLDALGARALRLRAERDAAARNGAGDDELAALDAAARALGEQQRAAVRERVDQRRRLEELLEPVRLGDPGAAVARLDAAVPIALLPIRLETRFAPGRLDVRIYPDQIHLHRHDVQMLESERDAAQGYWRQLWEDAASADVAWRALAASHGPERAAYLADRLRPQNLDARAHGDSPAFPEVETVPTRAPLHADARLLPSQWLVTLLDADGARMAQQWTKPVPERLSLSPFGDLLSEAALPPDADAAPGEEADDEEDDSLAEFDDAARWLVDFGRAVDVGMALTIDESSLEHGRFADGIARLIVVGVDTTRTPEEASQRLIEHLVAHGYSDGLAFLAPGTPSNNTSDTSSALRSNERERAASFTPQTPSEAPPSAEATLLARALGAAEAAPLLRFPGATADREATTAAMHAALFGATFGIFLSEVLDPLVDRSAIRDVRAHLERHVRPAGPYAALRVGRQPYGVLPVLATPLRYDLRLALGRISDRFTRELAQLLAKIRGWVERPTLNGVSPRTLDQLSTMAAVPPGIEPQHLLADILKQGPLAGGATVRPLGGRASAFLSAGQVEAAQRLHAQTVRLVLANLGVPNGGAFAFDDDGNLRVPLINQLFATRRPRYALDDVPWVATDLTQPGDAVRSAVDKVRVRIADAAADPTRIAGLLATRAEDAATLFEGLLGLSAAFEYWRAVEASVRDPAYEARFDSPLVTELVGIAPPAPAPAAQRRIDTPRQLLQLEAIGATPVGAAPMSLLSHVNAQVRAQAVAPAVAGARSFHAALDALPARPAAEIDRALRGLLDLGSHRLDAWLTSIATRRLAALRQQTPLGLHVGGYGFVHDLRPDTAPDSSEGWIHVPSPDHAVAAAVLRAAHMANRDDQPDAFAVRLDSARVRDALHLTEGMAEGQRVSALLGYRFERWLVEGRLQAKYIQAFRRLAPHATDVPAADGPQESLGARDVVDGQKLVELWRAHGEALLAQIAPLTIPPLDEIPDQDKGPLVEELQRLEQLFDAFLDLWNTEAVFQLSRGNRDRAAAALAVLDRQERPAEPVSVHTPRKAWGYVQRVLLVHAAAARADGWPDDVVARTEPGANVIAARLIGDPSRFWIAARAIDRDGVPLDEPVLEPLRLADVGLSPLALAMLAQPATAGHDASRLEQRIAALWAVRQPLPDGAGVALEPEPPRGSPAGAVGLARLLALLDAVRFALFDRRALTALDFAPPSGVSADGVDNAALQARAATLERALKDAEAALGTALDDEASQPAARRAALVAALQTAALLTPAATLAPAAEMQLLEEVLDDATAVRRALQQALRQWRAAEPAAREGDAGAADAADAQRDAAVEAAIARIRGVFGAGFPVLPPFALSPALAAEWRSSLGDQEALLAGAPKSATLQWLRTLSMVRGPVRALAATLDAAAWTGHTEAGLDSHVAQLPHRKGRRWVALPFDARRPPDDVRMSAYMIGDASALDGASVGVLIDEWTEAIPARATTTSLAFQYDAPAARPPQTVCLAVDAGVDGGTWSTDALLATVNEMFDQAQLRLLTPQQIPGAGSVLPTVFMPQNLSSEVPSLDLLSRVPKDAVMHAGILGKA